MKKTAEIESLYAHVREVKLHQTGGGCMLDEYILKDGTSVLITDEVIGLNKTAWELGEGDETDEIDHVYIDHIEPEKTGDNSGSNFFTDTLDIASDDGIVQYDLLRLKWGVVIAIDDAQITVFENEDAYQNNLKAVGIIQRP